jgi:hypothetical protein
MDKDIPSEVRTLLENTLHASGEYAYGEEIPEAALQEFYKKLNEYTSTYLLSSLPEDKLAQYKELNDKGAPPEILDIYAMKNIPNYSEVMKKAYKDFYESYMAKSHEEQQ